jgi:hypothetical protein
VARLPDEGGVSVICPNLCRWFSVLFVAHAYFCSEVVFTMATFLLLYRLLYSVTGKPPVGSVRE